MRFNRTCCNVFSDTFSRDEIAFFIFMNILLLYLCQGEYCCFNFYRYLPALTHDLFPEKIISVPSIVYIIRIICVYIVSSHRVLERSTSYFTTNWVLRSSGLHFPFFFTVGLVFLSSLKPSRVVKNKNWVSRHFSRIILLISYTHSIYLYIYMIEWHEGCDNGFFSFRLDG